MPVFWSTHAAYHTNARAVRHMLDLRLSPKAEHEIRRLARLFLFESMKVTPTLYEDIYDKYFGNK